MGKMIVLGGPSTSGKSTMQTELITRYPDRFQSLVTVTTRAPRPGEIDGVHYHFISVEEYDLACEQGEMPEQTVYAGVKYGVFKKTLEEIRQSDKHTIAVMDNVGVDWMRGYFGDDQVVGIYVGISEETMRERFAARGTSEEEIVRRITNAKSKEMTHGYIAYFDHHVMNQDRVLDDALSEILEIIDMYC